MDLTTYQKNLLESMASNEEILSRLYQIYSDKFSEYRDFWSEISREEIEHGKWIRTLLNFVIEGKALFNEERFSKWAVDNYREMVQNRINQIINSSINMKDETKFSLTLEESMIESKFFEVFQGDTPELSQVLIALEVSTNSHIERLLKLLNQL